MKCGYSSKSLKIQERKNSRKDLNQSKLVVSSKAQIRKNFLQNVIRYELCCLVSKRVVAFEFKAALSGKDEPMSMITAACHLPESFP